MILQIAINSPLRRCFDYLPPPDILPNCLKKGVRVRVPFRRQTTVGILVDVVATTSVAQEKLKTAIEILDIEPLFSESLFDLLIWASDYYQHPIGEVFLTALPTLLRKGRLLPTEAFYYAEKLMIKPHEKLVLNEAQAHAVQTMSTAMHQFGIYLLNGVTGSGKTEVYWRLIEKSLQNEKQVLILVPEIGLTPQLNQRLEEKLCMPVVVIHSGLTDKERLQAWKKARAGAPVVIGTRSAVFTPFLKLGLIVVDEEHDLSFKQQEGFRYYARDMAIMRGRKENIPVLLGSATPSLESISNAQKNRYTHLILPNRAGIATMPQFRIVDIRAKHLEEGLSSALLEAVGRHLAADQQVILFINRRGYAPVLLCHDCGWIAACQACDARLTLHQHMQRLMCHHCGFVEKVYTDCLNCSKETLLRLGVGTERIEILLKKHFPKATIARIDRDTMRKKGAMDEALLRAKEGESQILIGTQMLAKGHHFPKATLVGILDMDGGFFSADFRATERMAQLLMQVSGRAGREAKQGEVYLQTHQPNHPLLHKLLSDGYTAFAKALLEERHLACLPPFSYLALIRAEAMQVEAPMAFLKEAADAAKSMLGNRVNLLGPMPSPMEKKAGRYRVQLLMRAEKRSAINQGLRQLLSVLEVSKNARRIRWSVDVDPLEMF